MAHIGIVAPPLRGHLDPLSALAETLRARGHQVTFFLEADAADLVRDEAVSRLPGSAAAFTDALPTGAGGGIGSAIRAMARRTDFLCAALPSALRRRGINVVLADQSEAAGGLVARALGMPFASVACALPLNREDGVPPPYVGWRGAPWLNRGGYRVVDWLMQPLSRVIAARGPVRRGSPGHA